MVDQKLQYPMARRYLSTRAWAIRSETLDVMCELMRMRSAGITLTEDEIRARIGTPRTGSAIAPRPGVVLLTAEMSADAISDSIQAARGGAGVMAGAIAVIPLSGVIDQKIGSMSSISGGTTVDGFMKQFRQCLNDPGVAGIVFDVNSPGGSVFGVPEAAAEILAARGTKPIIAVADPEIASAAYYMACAADEMVCMPSGQVGSLGVFGVHDDYSAQNEMVGYKPTYISFGAYKTELNPDTPLDPDAQAYQQTQIDAIGNDFYKFVAKARGVPVDDVRANFGQGRMLLAKNALAAKMIDRIDTLDATITRVARMARSGAGGGPAAVETTRLITDLSMVTFPTAAGSELVVENLALGETRAFEYEGRPFEITRRASSIDDIAALPDEESSGRMAVADDEDLDLSLSVRKRA